MSKGWKQFERTLLVLLVLLLFALTGPLRLRSGGGEQSRVTALRTGWYQLSDGGRKEIQLPVRMEASGEGSIELWNDSLRPEDAGKVLSVGDVQYGPEVWLGETLLYRYKDNAFPKNDQMKGKLWADIMLPQETGTEPLRLIYTQTGDGELIIEAPELGSRQEITGRHLQRVSASLVIVVCMQCLGVISISTPLIACSFSAISLFSSRRIYSYTSLQVFIIPIISSSGNDPSLSPSRVRLCIITSSVVNSFRCSD